MTCNSILQSKGRAFAQRQWQAALAVKVAVIRQGTPTQACELCRPVRWAPLCCAAPQESYLSPRMEDMAARGADGCHVAGFAGADLRALCAGAVMAAVRRSAPQILLDPRMEQGIPLGPHLQPQASDDDAAKAWQQQQQGANLGQSIFLSSPSEPEGSHRSANGGEKQGCSLAQGTSGGMALEVGSAQTDAAEEQDGTLQHSQHAAVSIPEGSRAVNRAAPHPDLPDGSAASLAPLQSKHAETPASAQPEPQPETGNSQGPALGCTGPNAGASHMAFDGLPQEQHVPLGTAGVNAASVASLLEGLSVRACDWRKALASAPEACARRDSLAVLSADAAQPLPAALAPALLPACASALQVLVHVSIRWLP